MSLDNPATVAQSQECMVSRGCHPDRVYILSSCVAEGSPSTIYGEVMRGTDGDAADALRVLCHAIVADRQERKESRRELLWESIRLQKNEIDDLKAKLNERET